MGEPTSQSGPRRVTCAVCATEYDDDPEAHRIRRCPSCHSRLIRQADGGLGTLEAPAAPPKVAPPKRWKAADAGMPVMAIIGVLMIVVGLAIFVSQFGALMSTLTVMGPPTRYWLVYLAFATVCLVGGVVLVVRSVPRITPPRTGQACIGCDYVLPPRHRGRCPECGRLQNPDDPRNGKCPSCRRTLRGFFGDTCPECGADVRDVVDGRPPDQPLL